MTKMKKLMSVMLAFVMSFSLAAPAFAVSEKITTKDRMLMQYGISETVLSNGVIVRSLDRTNAAKMLAGAKNSDDFTRTELKLLGMDERVVDDMDRALLEELSAVQEIKAAITYYKFSQGSEPIIVSEETALRAINAEESGIQPMDSNYDENEYVKVVVTSSKSGTEYLITGSFDWLNEPLFGGTDALSIASMNCTFSSNKANGYINYREKTYSGNALVSDELKKVPQTPKLRTDDNGSVLGIGFDFSLLTDRYSSTTSKLVKDYSDWYGFVSARGTIIDPNLVSFYNTASYSHQHWTITVDPSFHIELSGKSPYIFPYVDVASNIKSAYTTLYVPVQQLT